MSTRQQIGPQLPDDPSERAVWGDILLENGFRPPWPLGQKPTKLKGSAIAKQASALMAKLADAQSTLSNLDEQRTKAEADVEAAEKALEGLGIDSLRDLRNIKADREYSVCAHPDCQRIEQYSWEPKDGWLCAEHISEEEKQRKAEEDRRLLDEYARDRAARAAAPAETKKEPEEPEVAF